jgi:hypothetical protein
MTWTCVGGRSYVVQTNAFPAANGFADGSPVIGVPGGFGGLTTNYLHPGGALSPARFYRVRLAP